MNDNSWVDEFILRWFGDMDLMQVAFITMLFMSLLGLWAFNDNVLDEVKQWFKRK